MNYAISYPLSSCDFNEAGVLNPYVLLKCLEDIAVKNASDNHFGVEEVLDQNVAWVLLKYAMEFNDYPQNIQGLIVETESRGVNRLFATRDFIIKDDTGQQLGRATSTWTVIDMKSKRMLNPQEVFVGCLPAIEKRPDDLKYAKIPAVGESAHAMPFDVQPADIDLNQHVNNCSYINWAFAGLAEEWKLGKKLQRLDINYKKEVLPEESVIALTNTEESSSTHSIKHSETGDELCIMSAQWRDC